MKSTFIIQMYKKYISYFLKNDTKSVTILFTGTYERFQIRYELWLEMYFLLSNTFFSIVLIFGAHWMVLYIVYELCMHILFMHRQHIGPSKRN